MNHQDYRNKYNLIDRPNGSCNACERNKHSLIFTYLKDFYQFNRPFYPTFYNLIPGATKRQMLCYPGPFFKTDKSSLLRSQLTRLYLFLQPCPIGLKNRLSNNILHSSNVNINFKNRRGGRINVQTHTSFFHSLFAV